MKIIVDIRQCPVLVYPYLGNCAKAMHSEVSMSLNGASSIRNYFEITTNAEGVWADLLRACFSNDWHKAAEVLGKIDPEVNWTDVLRFISETQWAVQGCLDQHEVLSLMQRMAETIEPGNDADETVVDWFNATVENGILTWSHLVT